MGEEGEEESALATAATAENGPNSDLRGRLEASTETGANSNGDVVGLEKIPRCSMQNLTVIMTRSVENAFYRLVKVI